MDESEYLKTRVDDQIAWYDKRSQSHRKWYKGLRVVEIVAAVLIPFLIAYTDHISQLKFVIGLLGLAVAVIAGLVALYRFQEHWTEYRVTCETLRHEKFLFLTRTDPYSVEDPFPLLVQRVESLISKEHTSWAQYVRSGARRAKDG